MKHGKTVIAATHDPRVAVRADMIIRLEDGVTKGEYIPVELGLARVNEEIEELQGKLMRGEISIGEAFERYQDPNKQKRALEDLLASVGG
ncbi:MAG: hypothetical protein F7B59_01195 [Desulfurococcales archaeon]|nr:hypothetical protein [Desulfurococcales archaeon]